MYPWQTHFKDYFQILEVSVNASVEVIHAAYKALMKKYHPDTQTGLNEGEKESFFLKTQEINEAYDVLKKSETYKAYKEDALLHHNEKMKRGDVLSYRYLKNWQNDLIKTQARYDHTLSKKESIKEKKPSSYKKKSLLPLDLEELLEDFYNTSKEKELESIITYLESMTPKKIQLFIEEFFMRFQKIPLIQESLLLKLGLKTEIWLEETIIKRAFKYKFLYINLFPYIAQKKMSVFYNKVEKIAKNTYFSSPEALDYTTPLLNLCNLFMDPKEFKLLKRSVMTQLKKEKKYILESTNEEIKDKYQKLIKSL